MSKETLKQGIVIQPILHSETNLRCQIDLIGLQTIPDGNYKFNSIYQDRPMRTLAQNVRLKVLDIDRTKTDAKSIVAVVVDVKYNEFYQNWSTLYKLVPQKYVHTYVNTHIRIVFIARPF